MSASTAKHKCQKERTVIFNRCKFRRKGSCLNELWGVMAAEYVQTNRGFLPNFSGVSLCEKQATKLHFKHVTKTCLLLHMRALSLTLGWKARPYATRAVFLVFLFFQLFIFVFLKLWSIPSWRQRAWVKWVQKEVQLCDAGVYQLCMDHLGPNGIGKQWMKWYRHGQMLKHCAEHGTIHNIQRKVTPKSTLLLYFVLAKD